jgi:RNA polymerase sigma-70 factor, ECF subfamily
VGPPRSFKVARDGIFIEFSRIRQNPVHSGPIFRVTKENTCLSSESRVSLGDGPASDYGKSSFHTGLVISEVVLDETGCPVAFTEIDKNLLKRCLAESPGAWRDFVDRFMGLFVQVVRHSAQARSVRVSPEDVDDICAEIFLTLLTDNYAVLRRFEGRSSLATYLTVIARRIAVRELAQRRIAEAFGHVNAHQASVDQAVGRTNSHPERVEDSDEVQSILDDLPPIDAEIVRLYHLESKSYREISSQLGIPENSIGPTLHRAKEKIRRRRVSP